MGKQDDTAEFEDKNALTGTPDTLDLGLDDDAPIPTGEHLLKIVKFDVQKDKERRAVARIKVLFARADGGGGSAAEMFNVGGPSKQGMEGLRDLVTATGLRQRGENKPVSIRAEDYIGKTVKAFVKEHDAFLGCSRAQRFQRAE